MKRFLVLCGIWLLALNCPVYGDELVDGRKSIDQVLQQSQNHWQKLNHQVYPFAEADRGHIVWVTMTEFQQELPDTNKLLGGFRLGGMSNPIRDRVDHIWEKRRNFIQDSMAPFDVLLDQIIVLRLRAALHPLILEAYQNSDQPDTNRPCPDLKRLDDHAYQINPTRPQVSSAWNSLAETAEYLQSLGRAEWVQKRHPPKYTGFHMTF